MSLVLQYQYAPWVVQFQLMTLAAKYVNVLNIHVCGSQLLILETVVVTILHLASLYSKMLLTFS